MRKWKKKRYWIRSKLQEPTRHLVQACDAIASEWDPGMTHRHDGCRAVQSHRVVPQLDFEFVEKNVIYNVQVTKLLQYLKFSCCKKIVIE